MFSLVQNGPPLCCSAGPLLQGASIHLHLELLKSLLRSQGPNTTELISETCASQESHCSQVILVARKAWVPRLP